MSKILLITNPNDDRPNKYLGAWCEKIIKLAETKKNIQIINIENEDVNKLNLTNVIERESPRLVLFNGHGNHDRICGFQQQVLIRVGDNEHLLKNKIIHALACSSGKTLAPKSIAIGTLTYIGYSENFKLTHLNKQAKEERLQDEVANFFLEPAFEVVMSLIEGDNVEDAYTKSRNLYIENFKLLFKSKKTDYNTTIASRLFNNIQCQICLGDKDAKL